MSRRESWMGASTMAAASRFTSNPPTGEAGLLDEAGESLGDARLPLALEQGRDVGPGDEHEIVLTRDLGVKGPERLSQGSLHRVPLYGAADLSAHGDAKTRVVLARFAVPTGKRVQHEKPVRVRVSLAIDAVEVAAARQAPALAAPARRAGAHGVSRLRPLRRLRLMISRPPRVRIRARNP